MVEQVAVNDKVAGSNPAAGAMKTVHRKMGFFHGFASWLENQTFAQQKWFGVVSGANKCLHFFANERKSEFASDIQLPEPKQDI